MQANDYFFLATEDHLFENPANWFPHYPGTQVQEGDKVTIMADVSFAGYNLDVKGVLEVMLDARIHSPDGSIIIRKGGLLDNNGKILVEEVNNYGRLYNRIASIVHIYSYIAFSGSHTHNAYSAIFRTISSLINKGRFDNYSSCIAGTFFKNMAEFNQIRESQLDVSGDILLTPGSVFKQSSKSVVYVGMQDKVIVPSQLQSVYP